MEFDAIYDMVNELEVETDAFILEIDDSEEYISVEMTMRDGVINLSGEDLHIGSHIVLRFKAEVEGLPRTVEIMAEVTKTDESDTKLKLLNVRSVK